MEPPPAHDTPGRRVIRRASLIAGETGELCRPIHVVAALAELEGPISDALKRPGGGPLFAHAVGPLTVHGGGSGYLVMQTQMAASQFASGRGEIVGPEHLLLAVIDQAEPEAIALLIDAGLDVGAVRRAALAMLGAPPDLPPIQIPPPVPSGTHDRPPLPVGELDPRAWAALCWRQDHLPLKRVSRRSHWGALWHLEFRAVWRVASRLELDDDQRYSLSHHHLDRVERIVAGVHPFLVELRSSQPRNSSGIWHLAPVGGPRRIRRPQWLNFTVGWGTWFANRRVGLRDRWFRVSTITHYRGAPRP